MVLDAILTTEIHAQMTVADQRAPSSQRGGVVGVGDHHFGHHFQRKMPQNEE
jgi:hypothetical protein